jgi:azurin
MKPTVRVFLALGIACATVFSSPALLLAQKAAAPAGPRTIEIKASDTMKFDVTTITAKPGEPIRVRLIAVGTLPKIAMSHNFVLLKSTANAKAFAEKAMTANTTGYIPADLKPQIIIASALIGGGEKTEVSFKAPTAPGKYPYLCTFPGHFQAGMTGVLVVK